MLKDVKRNLVEKIWGLQLIKKCFYKVSRKHMGTIKNIKMSK